MTPAVFYNRKNIRRIICAVCLLSAGIAWGNSFTIYAKAYLAKHLIAHAWQATLANQQDHTPWSWADTWPVAKLYIPKTRETFYVLSGAQGASLAFGPGLVHGSPKPETKGTQVIGGHRDTHFRFLKKLTVGDIFLLQNKHGEWRYFSITATHVLDSRQGPWLFDPSADEVHLITCFPFDAAVPGGPLRFVAIAKPTFDTQEETLSI